MKWVIGIIFVVCIGSLARADGPAANLPGREGGREHMRRGAAPTEAQWNELMTFMKEHAPRRAAMLASLPADRAGRMKMYAYSRYSELMELKQEDQAIFDARVRNLELEDAVFGLVMDLKKQTDPKQKEALRQQLRQKVLLIVQAWLDERQHRIEKLEQSLAREKERLANSRKNIDKLVDQRMEQIMKGEHSFGEGRRRESDEHSSRGKQGRDD